jgi:CDP-diacylglycerol--serine O-phosphatidyltransferase
MTDILESIRRIMVPIHKEGYPFIAIAAVLALCSARSGRPRLDLCILTVWVCYFFRDPPRTTPVRDGLVVSPADGRVSLITTAVPPPELDLPQEPDEAGLRVHERVRLPREPARPVSGRITPDPLHAGLFLNAELDKASEDNERKRPRDRDAAGADRRRADRGLVAAASVSFVKEGERWASASASGSSGSGPGSMSSCPATPRCGSGSARWRSPGETRARGPVGERAGGGSSGPRLATPYPLLAAGLPALPIFPAHERPLSAVRPGRRAAAPPVQAGALRVIAPNLITLIALCLGLTAIRLAYEERLEPACIAIWWPPCSTGRRPRGAPSQGHLPLRRRARLPRRLREFRVAPALVLYSFVLHHMKALGWIVALVFAICAALRLARFNVMIDDPNRPEWKKNFFVGMAAPAGAITVMLPTYLYFLGVPMASGMAPLALVYVLLIGFLMVSTIPTYSGKTMGKHVPREWVLPIFVLTVAFFGLLVSFPFQVLAVSTVLFLSSIPFGVARYRHLERTHRQPVPEAVPVEEPPPAA